MSRVVARITRANINKLWNFSYIGNSFYSEVCGQPITTHPQHKPMSKISNEKCNKKLKKSYRP
jgi:hypothetical protein